MDISARRILTAAALAAAVCAAPASAATTDHTLVLGPDALTGKVTGATATGFNTSYFLDGIAGPGGTCGKDTQTMCETTLVHVVAPETGGGTITFRLDGFQPYSDFDLRAYEADADGTPVSDMFDPTGDSESSPLGGIDPRATRAGDFETSHAALTADDAIGGVDQYFLVRVPYFMVPSDKYDLTVKLSDLTPYTAPTE
jgi:hypothetical protein